MTDTNQLPPLPPLQPGGSHMESLIEAAIQGHASTREAMRWLVRQLVPMQARAKVLGEAEATHQAAERYLWLRDGFHKGDLRKTRRPSDAPYVVNPQKSVLYGIEAYRGQALDRAIDEDRLNDLAQHIYEEALVNGDSRFSEPDFRFSDEFANECLDKARAAMATAPQPAQAKKEGA